MPELTLAEGADKRKSNTLKSILFTPIPTKPIKTSLVIVISQKIYLNNDAIYPTQKRSK